jgi:hypothetical protein
MEKNFGFFHFITHLKLLKNHFLQNLKIENIFIFYIHLCNNNRNCFKQLTIKKSQYYGTSGRR